MINHFSPHGSMTGRERRKDGDRTIRAVNQVVLSEETILFLGIEEDGVFTLSKLN